MYRGLLGENVAAQLADTLDLAGHDRDCVVDVSELGDGVHDTSICLHKWPTVAGSHLCIEERSAEPVDYNAIYEGWSEMVTHD